MPKSGPIPAHHKNNFQTMILAAKDDNLALMSCLDVATGEDRSVICMVNFDGQEYHFLPVGHMCPLGNPFEAYTPPDAQTDDNVMPITIAEEKKVSPFSIYIGMGRDRDVGLDLNNHLLFKHGDEILNLGHTTKMDIDRLCEYLQRLKIHVPDA